MAILKGYFDESGKENDPEFQDSASSVAGCIGTAENWALIESGWARVLRDFEVPYLHMKEYAHSKGPFEAWKGQEDIRADFIEALVGSLQDRELYGVGAIVRHPDLHKFNQEYGLEIEAYSLGIYAMMIHSSRQFPDGEIEFLLDKVDRQTKKITIAQQYAATDNHYPGCGNRIKFVASANVSSESCIPLQVADFVAYEVLKAHRSKNDYFLKHADRDPTNYPLDFTLWQARTSGCATFPPKERLSLEKLSTTLPIDGIIWDYKCLCGAHNARGNSW